MTNFYLLICSICSLFACTCFIFSETHCPGIAEDPQIQLQTFLGKAKKKILSENKTELDGRTQHKAPSHIPTTSHLFSIMLVT